MKRRLVRHGEALAIDPRAIQADGPQAFFDFFFDPPCPPNERIGNVAVVHVRGPLDHHEGYGASYEAITARVASALDGSDERSNRQQRLARQRYRGEGSGEPTSVSDDPDMVAPPIAVVMCIDSPGGTVSGLFETVRQLRVMSEGAGIPLIAYVNEMAASAAYALACACDEIYLPPSAIAGSIGVISTMADQTAADEERGLRFVTLSSGKRKSDGHPHVAISDEAIDAEQGRVDKFARQFYRMVEKARGMAVSEVAGLEAAIFVGSDAVAAGLADGVMTWDAVIETLDRTDGRVSSSPETPDSAGVKDEMLKLKALIDTTKKALASTTDAKVKATLTASLAAYEATLAAVTPDAKIKHVIEHKETHTADDDAPPEHKEAVPEPKPAGEEPEEEEEEDKATAEDTEEEAAAAEILRSALAKVPAADRTKVNAQLAAMKGKAKMFDQHGARLAKLEADAKAREKDTIVSAALTARRITPGEAKMLRTKSASFVAEFMTMRPKAIVHGGTDELARAPATNPDAVAAQCTDEELKLFSAASSMSGIPVDKLVAHHRAEQAKLNGASGAGSY